MEAHLKKLGVEYYTHDKPGDRPYRVVLRGLPLVDPENLKHRLKENHDLIPQAVHIIKRKGKCAALEESFYLLHFPKGYTNLLKLREIKAVGNIVVRWKAYRNKRVDVTQCPALRSRDSQLPSHEKMPLLRWPPRNGFMSGPRSLRETVPQLFRDPLSYGPTQRAEYIRIRQNATNSNQPGRRPARNNPAVPALSTTHFPPLPSHAPAVPAQARMNIPPPSGSSSYTPLPGRPLPAGKAVVWILGTGTFRGALQYGRDMGHSSGVQHALKAVQKSSRPMSWVTCCAHMGSSEPRSLCVSNWNARSVRPKKIELEEFLARNKIDVGIISETRLTPSRNFSLYTTRSAWIVITQAAAAWPSLSSKVSVTTSCHTRGPASSRRSGSTSMRVKGTSNSLLFMHRGSVWTATDHLNCLR